MVTAHKQTVEFPLIHNNFIHKYVNQSILLLSRYVLAIQHLENCHVQYTYMLYTHIYIYRERDIDIERERERYIYVYMDIGNSNHVQMGSSRVFMRIYLFQ